MSAERCKSMRTKMRMGIRNDAAISHQNQPKGSLTVARILQVLTVHCLESR